MPHSNHLRPYGIVRGKAESQVITVKLLIQAGSQIEAGSLIQAGGRSEMF